MTDYIENETEIPTVTPLWRYVQKVDNEPNSKGGGGAKFICGFGCKKEPYTGSYSRVRAHLIGMLPGQKSQGIQLCPKLDKDERELLKQEELNAQKLFSGNTKARKFNLPSSISQKTSLGVSPTNSAINKMFQVSSRDEVDQKVARCLYGCGIPFNVVRSPLWADMISAINNAPKGYKSPNYEKVRTTLLDQEQHKVQQSLAPLMQDWDTHGVSIASDGWSNVKNESLVNVMAISSGKAIFMNAHEVFSVEKSGENIAELLLNEIEKIGPSNIVQVITDNAANCKLAGSIIRGKYPHIFWSGCLAHTLNLLMKDIAKSDHFAISYIGETFKRGGKIVKYIKNHSMCQSLFKTFSKLELLRVKKTRFGHNFIVLHRLVKVRAYLVAMVLSRQWEQLRKYPNYEQHDDVHKTIMDEDFWGNASKVLKITKPIYTTLRFFDSDKAIIGEVYEQMDTLLGTIKDTLATDEIASEVIQDFVVQRWDKMNVPLHCLAYVLVPKYYTHEWLMKPAPGGVRRIKPHFDKEVQRGYLETIDSMVLVSSDIVAVRQQISDFVSNQGVFSHPSAIHDRLNMSAISWWHLYGGLAPELYAVALKVLSQSVNSSSAERCWSTYSFIHSVKRNRLNASRAEKLVYVHYNQRSLTRHREDYESGYKNWDTYSEKDINIEVDLATLEAIEEEASFDNDGVDEQHADNFVAPTTQVLLDSSSATSSSSQGSSLDQARKRLEIARGKRQKK